MESCGMQQICAEKFILINLHIRKESKLLISN